MNRGASAKSGDRSLSKKSPLSKRDQVCIDKADPGVRGSSITGTSGMNISVLCSHLGLYKSKTSSDKLAEYRNQVRQQNSTFYSYQISLDDDGFQTASGLTTRKSQQTFLNQSMKNQYTFDRVFSTVESNAEIYQDCIEQEVEQSLNGINSTIMLYGVTGSGKTHTVFGDLGYRDPSACANQESGIMIHAFEKLLARHDCTLSVMYVEVYNEQVKDLLGKEDSLMITENASGEVSIQGVQTKQITSYEQVVETIKAGNMRRKTAKTCANSFSSRSHAIFQIIIQRRSENSHLYSKLSFIDLAGSERVDLTRNKGLRLIEGSNINKSLLALGKVINTLSEGESQSYVPYRDSKLTRLLKDSLGGNTRTVLITCITLSKLQIDETIHSLNYSMRAKRIKQQFIVNKQTVEARQTSESACTNMNQYMAEIDVLRSQVHFLREQLAEERNQRKDAEMKVKELTVVSHHDLGQNSNDIQQWGSMNHSIVNNQPQGRLAQNSSLSREVSPSLNSNRPKNNKKTLEKPFESNPLGVNSPDFYIRQQAAQQVSVSNARQVDVEDLNLDRIKRMLDKVNISIDGKRDCLSKNYKPSANV